MSAYWGVKVGSDDTVYVTGGFTGSVTVADLGITLTSAVGGTKQSTLVLALEGATGVYKWAQAFGNDGYGFETALSPDGTALYVTGYNSGAASFGGRAVSGDLGGFAVRGAEAALLNVVDVGTAEEALKLRDAPQNAGAGVLNCNWNLQLAA